MVYFFTFMTALFASLLVVPSLRRWAQTKGVLDLPDRRKVHATATPRLGGIAIFLCSFLALIIFVDLNQQLRGIIAGATVVFLTGLVDDFQGLSARKKLCGQILASCITIAISGLYITYLGNLLGFGEIVLPVWFAIPFTIFAMVGGCNAINLIDGLDGLAGGISFIILGSFAGFAFNIGNYDVLALSLALLGALLGFLKYNSYPARIFMGDSGSLTLGFFISFLAVALTQAPERRLAPVIPLIVLGLPVIDTIWVMVSRLLKRSNPFRPDMTHVHHKFLNLGFQHRFTVILIYGISSFWAIFCFIFHRSPEYLLFWTYLLMSIASYLVVRFILKRPKHFSWLQKDSPSSLTQSQLFLNFQKLVERGSSSLKFILVIFLLLAVGIIHPTGNHFPMICLVLFAGGILLFFLTREADNHFLFLLLYAEGFVIVQQFQKYQDQLVFSGVIAGQIVNALFFIAAVLVLLKFVSRGLDDNFFTSPLDFLILSVSLPFAVVGPDWQPNPSLAPVIAKAMLFFLIIKVIAASGRESARLVLWSVQTTLLVLALRGYLQF